MKYLQIKKMTYGFSDRIKSSIVQSIIYLYVLLFLYASATKLLDHSEFVEQLSKSPILTDIAWLLVWLVPITEIIIAITLLLPKIQLIGLYASFVLMSLFTGYIIAILNSSSHIPCSCGGILSRMTWNEHLTFNIIFMILAIVSIILKELLIKKDDKRSH